MIAYLLDPILLYSSKPGRYTSIAFQTIAIRVVYNHKHIDGNHERHNLQ